MAQSRYPRTAFAAALIGLCALASPFVAVHPAYADSAVDRAVTELRDGGLWSERGAEGIPAEARKLIKARLDTAKTKVRVLELASGDATAAVNELGRRIGEPGLYVAIAHERRSTGDTTTTMSWQTVGAGYDSAELTEHLNYGPGGIPGRLLAVPDLLDDDLLPAVRAAADDKTVYVHPAISAAFPDIDAKAIAERYPRGSDVRVAVLPRSVREDEDLADALLGPLSDKGIALLAYWDTDDFALVPASGPDGPDPVELGAAMAPAPTGPDELPVALAEFAPLAAGGVLDAATAALGEEKLYVHPMAVTDVSAKQRAKLASGLAGLDEPVCVAVLPDRAVEFEGAAATGAFDREATAKRVAAGGSCPVAILTVDGLGRVDDRLTYGELQNGAGPGGIYDMASAVNLGYTRESVRASLTEITALLDGDDFAFDGSEEDDGIEPMVLLAIALAFLGPGALIMFSLVIRSRRRSRRRRAEESAAAEERARRAAQDAEALAELRAENGELITRLGAELADAATPAVDPLTEFERLLERYDDLKRDNAASTDFDAVADVNERAQSALTALTRWNYRQRGDG